jgi:hypothetical protein
VVKSTKLYILKDKLTCFKIKDDRRQSWTTPGCSLHACDNDATFSI